MLIIRLQRVGKKKSPAYRLVISEKSRDTQDVYLEQLGTFNPRVKENGFLPNAERINYWISKGAQTSATINNLLIKAGIIKGEKKKSVFLSQKRKKKIADKSASAKVAVDKKAAEVAASPAAVVVHQA
ncbi:MAG: 30S ribosomal protein S16 [Parcubacteria group bacterium GW2011_GWA2_53_21]|nr:MAG: 30S ribosomal protein S16 [Parcubacteria group bacterium GW2011_GWA2_53_21]